MSNNEPSENKKCIVEFEQHKFDKNPMTKNDQTVYMQCLFRKGVQALRYI